MDHVDLPPDHLFRVTFQDVTTGQYMAIELTSLNLLDDPMFAHAILKRVKHEFGADEDDDEAYH